jgi:signal transduction histidine kinase
MEYALQAERDKLMTILNAMEDAVYTVRKGYEIDYANPCLERRFGPAIGRKCYEYFRGRSDPCPWCLNQEVLAGRTVIREWQSNEPDEKDRRTYESIHIPLNNTDGTFLKLGVLHDITDRKLAEDRLLEYQQRLRSLASSLALSEERERRRIACHVHDRIGHSLSLCIIKLDGLLSSMPKCETREFLSQIQIDIRALAEETRSLTFEISSPLLHEVGLEAALERLVDDFQSRHAIDAVFYNDRRSKPLDHDVCVLVFQCVDELLMNVAKHSMAHNVRVACERSKEGLLVSVADNGVGLDTILLPRREGSGFGLFAIRERMRSVGGHLRIESKPGEGSKITLVVPLRLQSE